MADFSKIPPGATLDIKPFKAHVDEEKLQHFKDLLKLSPVGPAVFENTNCGRKFGMTRDYLEKAKEYWLNGFDWRKHEDRINGFPNFKASVKDSEDNTIELQFLALFSERADAIPIGFYHGWPGSICEFLDMLDIIRERYTPQDLPYHVIVPSLPGYAYSSGPPLDKDYATDIAAGAIHNLMLGLGFGGGYISQGGDIGSFISRVLVSTRDECKGMHVNMFAMPPPPNQDELPLDDLEKKVMPRGPEFYDTGFAYALEHGTRTATIGLALSASPLAMLSWIGEKFLEWTDEDPPLDKILEDVTLYWMTDTFPRCIYPYRGLFAQNSTEERPRIARNSVIQNRSARKVPHIDKPCGYSLFPGELFPIPKSWAATTCNLVHYSQHTSGGHFAAMEKPAELLADVEEYVKKAWKGADTIIPAR